jgi:hypothetical protein
MKKQTKRYQPCGKARYATKRQAEGRQRRRGDSIDRRGRPERFAAPFIAKGAAGWRAVSESTAGASDDTGTDSE